MLPTLLRTGIGRPLDFRYRSNRFVAITAMLAGLGALAWRWSTGGEDALLGSFKVAGGAFLAWAIGRELDPDDTRPATLAALIVLPLMALGLPSFGSTFAVLIGIRIAVRTTGLAPQWIDGVVLTAAASYLGTQPETWPALAVLIAAMGADHFADPPGPARTLWFSAIMLSAAVIGATMLSSPPTWTLPTSLEWVVLGVTLVAVVFTVVNTLPPRSRGDITHEALGRGRLRFGRMLAFLALIGGVITQGGPATAGLTPVWAASIGVAVVSTTRRGQRRREPNPSPLETS